MTDHAKALNDLLYDKFDLSAEEYGAMLEADPLLGTFIEIMHETYGASISRSRFYTILMCAYFLGMEKERGKDG